MINTGGAPAATVFIADDGVDIPQVSISARGSGSYELIPYRPAKYNLSIAAAWGVDLPVVCALSGTAVAGIDYTNTAMVTNVIPAGTTSIIATVTPIDNGVNAVDKTIGDKVVTYDFARMMDGATEVKCSEFGTALIERL